MKRIDSRPSRLLLLAALTVVLVLASDPLPGAEAGPNERAASIVPKRSRFERVFQSTANYQNSFQEATLQVTFTAPSGESCVVNGFWHSGNEWRVRFLPNEVGTWKYSSTCSDNRNIGLHHISGSFFCTANTETMRFTQHGPVRLSPNRRFLMHEDTAPFFWLADTAWNGALMSTAEEWEQYLAERVRQKFTAVQWVTTQWRAAPEGDRLKEPAFTGGDRIVLNPDFFKRLDAKVEAANRAGLLNAPVLLWAIGGGSNPSVNPGFSLPEDQAIRLASYMVARWQGNHVIWILAGDGDYRQDKAEKWKRIGEAVFGEIRHAPVIMHPGGMQWIMDEFRGETWLDLCGYQSGHGDDTRTLQWMLSGPPTTDWKIEPPRPFLNLEPPYENHIAYQSKKPISAHTVRRAIYWSLLNAPPAGVTYGGHGVWGWDDGTRPPTDHPNTGTPLPWNEALTMPAAEQMNVVYELFTSFEYGRLRPAPELLSVQPGREQPHRFVATAKTEMGQTAVVYIPEDRSIELRLSSLPPHSKGLWINPRSGARSPLAGAVNGNNLQVATPTEGDWILLFTQKGVSP